MTPIRLLIADDHDLVRCGLRVMLEAEEDFLVVAEVDSGEAALERAQETEPDVVLMDVIMPGLGGIEATRRLPERSPNSRILMVSALEEPSFVRAALAAGAAGYMSKAASEQALINGVRAVHRGHSYMCVPLTESGLRGVICRDDDVFTCVPKATELRLSEREAQVLELVAFGYTAPEIAAQLHVGVKTVESYRSRLSRKLGLKTRAQIVRYALGIGLFQRSKLLESRRNT